MKKTMSFIILITTALLMLLSCSTPGSSGGSGGSGGGGNGGSGNSYKTSNLPEKYSVDIPDSIQSQSNSSQQAVLSLRKTLMKAPGDESFAYTELSQEINLVSMFFQQFEIDFMIIDSVYTDIMDEVSNQSGSIDAETITGTFTEEMVNKMKEMFGESGDQGMFPSAGESMALPAMDVVVDESDSDGDGYNYAITYNENIPGELTSTITFKWNTAKTKVFVCGSMEMSFEGENMQQSFKCSYDGTGAKEVVSIQIQGEDSMGTFSTIIKMEGTSGSDEITIISKNDFTDPEDNKMLYELKGKAGNDGGYVEVKITDDLGTEQYREEFNGSGEMQSQAQFNGVDWDGDEIDEDFDLDIVTKSLSITAGETAMNNADTEIYSFTVVPASAPDPSSDIEGFFNSIIGFGIYDPTGAGILESEYWGESAQITNAKIYLESFDGTDFSYTQISGVTLAVQ